MFKIAVIEDEQLFLSDLMESIKKCDDTVTISGFLMNSEKVIQSVIGFDPDIVFCDISMPVIDGLELIRLLKGQLMHTKYVLVSGFVDFEYAKRGIQLGVKEYLNKPVEEDILIALLDSLKKEIINDRKGNIEIVVENDHSNSKIFVSEKSKDAYSGTDIAEAVKAIFDEQYPQQFSINGLARSFYVTPKHLISTFNKKYGLSPLQYLQSKRIEKARDLLGDKDMKIDEIAFSVGYMDINYFYRIFKKTVGVSPREYRNSIIGNNQSKQMKTRV